MLLESTFLLLLPSSLLIFAIAFCAKKSAPPQSSEMISSKSAVRSLKPKTIPLTPKEQLIAQGVLKRGKHDYPTLDDVVSDWSSSGEESKEPAKKQKGRSKKSAGKKKKKVINAKEVATKSQSGEHNDR